MRRIREVLRYRYEQGLSLERIACSLGLAKGSVHSVVDRFGKSGLSWPLESSLTDSALEERLYGAGEAGSGEEAEPIDLEYVRKELARPHVTLELLWREYHDGRPDGMSRATFYRRCGEGLPHLGVDMRMVHKGGDKLFVDYSGDGLFYIDR
jgi:transposase